MNDQIRAQVEARLQQQQMTRADLARAVGVNANAITRALNNTGGRGGKVPDLWAHIFDALGLHLKVESERSDQAEQCQPHE